MTTTHPTTEVPKRRGRGTATDVDRHVGTRVRERRTMLGMNQTDLGAALGVSVMQVSKFERGLNRITAGQLYVIARALGADVGDFFRGLPGDDG